MLVVPERCLAGHRSTPCLLLHTKGKPSLSTHDVLCFLYMETTKKDPTQYTSASGRQSSLQGLCFSPFSVGLPLTQMFPLLDQATGHRHRLVPSFCFSPPAIYEDFDQMRRGQEALPSFFLPSGVTKSGAEERGTAEGS